MAEKLIKETGGADAVVAAPRGGPKRREITIIQEGWGSSGYYAKEVLERDGARAFPKGTHMYINHQTEAERAARPERDIKDLAAVLVTDPVMKGIKLVAEAEIFDHWEPVISALAENIGTSIVANGVAVEGSAGGKDGPIIKALTEGHSVDFVTRAGAGGEVGPLIESAHAKSVELKESRMEESRNMANWLEARIHSRFTDTADMLFAEGHVTRDERIHLSTAIGEGLKAFNTSVEANVPGLLARDPFAEAPTGDVSVEEKKEPDEGSPIKESNMDNEKELSDLRARLRDLEEADKKKTQEIADLKESDQKNKDRADRAEETLRAREAGKIVAEAIKDVDGLPATAKKRVVESVLRKGLPQHSDGKLDSGLLKERALTGVREEQEYIKGLTGDDSPVSEATGGGLAAISSGSGGGGTDAETDAALEEGFRELGLSEAEAKTATKGR